MKNYIFVLLIILLGRQMKGQHIQTILDVGVNVNFIQHSIVEFDEETYIIAGTVVPGPISGNSDILVLSVDIFGNILWKKYIDYGYDEFVGSIIVDSNKNIVLAGNTGIIHGETTAKNLIVVKLDDSGNLINDAVIKDVEPGFEYSLYGLDLEEVENRELPGYILVGTGVQAATSTASKYAFVLLVSPTLDGIYWGYKYQSNNTTNEYDVFNHVLKVQGLLDGEAFLLTGSGKEPTTGQQMVTNDLITLFGNSLWAQPRGNDDLTSVSYNYISPGIMSLYKKSTNKFYVFTYGVENIPAIVTLDGSTGISTGNNHFLMHVHNYPDINENTLVVNGMTWKDSNQKEIILSGYYLPYDTRIGYPFAMELKLASPTNTTYFIYPSVPFSGNDLLNINFDFIVKPINYTNAPTSSIFNRYYQPKTMSHNFIPDLSYHFVAPFQEEPETHFGVSFMNTDASGGLANFPCAGVSTYPSSSYSWTQFSNFIRSRHEFKIIGNGAGVINAGLTNELTCMYSVARPTMGSKSPKGSFEIKIYPNPTTGKLLISGLSGIENAIISIYDITGRKVMALNATGRQNEKQLSLSKLQDGIYYIRISSMGSFIYQEKVIKKQSF